MKSLLIIFAGLGICFWGFYLMWNGAGMLGAKPYYIVGGSIVFIGALVNHWEHTRRRE
jgi:hypothetical protein